MRKLPDEARCQHIKYGYPYRYRVRSQTWECRACGTVLMRGSRLAICLDCDNRAVGPNGFCARCAAKRWKAKIQLGPHYTR